MKMILLSLMLFHHLNAESLFIFPLSSDYIKHPGEGFCDEMYYYSYHSRKYHTAIDYIRKWKGSHLISGINDYSILLEEYIKLFGRVPNEAGFWTDTQKGKDFLKINLYREGMDIVDTSLGLYPREFPDLSYGHSDTIKAIYDGLVIDSFNPSEPKGWGKSILLEHSAPRGKVFSIKWKDTEYALEKVWSGYFHNSENLVKDKQKVIKGQPIARIGDANGIFNSLNGVRGIQEGSHLHFEIRIKYYGLFPKNQIQSNLADLQKIYIDPEYFLNNVVIK